MVSYTSKPLPQHPPLDEFGMMLKKTVHWNSGSAYATKSGDRATEDECRLVADKHMPTNCAAKILHLYNDVLSHGHIPVLARNPARLECASFNFCGPSRLPWWDGCLPSCIGNLLENVVLVAHVNHGTTCWEPSAAINVWGVGTCCPVVSFVRTRSVESHAVGSKRCRFF